MDAKNQSNVLVVCHECDALPKVPGLNPGSVAVCICCGSSLFKTPAGCVENLLALVIASMILFLVANIFPIVTLNIAGIERATTLTGSALIFIDLGKPELAATVWLSSVFIPGVIIFGLLYVLISIRFHLHWRYSKQTLVWIGRLLPWGMMDVFFLGVLVALVKLVALADILLGTGFYAFVVLIFVYAAAIASLEPRVLWEFLGRQSDSQN